MDSKPPTDIEWDLDSAELAFGVIARYVEHAQISGVVIALLASALGEEKLKPLADSQYWQSFMASKRSLSDAKVDIERLTALIESARRNKES